MTRFARAKGSKASNERLPEEATSWSEMKKQLLESKQEKEQNNNREEFFKQRQNNYESFLQEKEQEASRNTKWAEFPGLKNSINVTKAKKRKNSDTDEEFSQLKNKLDMVLDGKKAKDFSKNESDSDEPPEQTSIKSKPAEIVVKKPKIKKKSLKITIDADKKEKDESKGPLNKNKKSGLNGKNEKNLEDVPEHIRKKIEKKKQKRLKQVLKKNKIKSELKKEKQDTNEKPEENGVKSNIKSKKVKNKVKKANNFEPQSLEDVAKNELAEELRKDKKMKVKKAKSKAVKKVEKKELTEAELKKIEKKKNKKLKQLEKRKKFKELKKQNEDGKVQNPNAQIESTTSEVDGQSSPNNTNKCKKPDATKKTFQDRRNLTNSSENNQQGNEMGDLNDNPQGFNSKFNKSDATMKKSFQEKRKQKLRDKKDHQRKKPKAEKWNINGKKIEIEYVDSFPVKKEDAERLKKLRKEMISKGLPRSEIDRALKLERRKAEKDLARERKKVCFHCRKSGHMLSECPELGKDEMAPSSGTGICFKCGSTEHTHFQCKVVRNDTYSYATCFICNEQGHISKQCPDNARGLYPKGGACKVCGDVTHLKKDCLKYQAQQQQLSSSLSLGTISNGNVEDLDGEERKNSVVKHRTNKIVKF